MTLDGLRERFGNPAVDLLLKQVASGASPEIDPALFARGLADLGVTVDAGSLLDVAAAEGLLSAFEALRCPVAGCDGWLSLEDVATGRCPTCDTDLRELGEDPISVTRYLSGVLATRDIPWFIAIHGMNTHGDWQQEFSWQIANKLKYSAPVLIYKYGLIRASVLFRWRHRIIARTLGLRIRQAVAQAARHHIGEPPDILIHSFGTQLFRLILEMDEFEELRFGRVIAVGSVIRPDFDWAPFIRSGRIEAVLNHCAGKDCAVPFAQYFIPGCGPGGRHGFLDTSVVNILNENFGHSSALENVNLAVILGKGGVWDKYLTAPEGALESAPNFPRGPWKPQWRPLRGLIRLLGITLILLLVVGLLAGAAEALLWVVEPLATAVCAWWNSR